MEMTMAVRHTGSPVLLTIALLFGLALFGPALFCAPVLVGCHSGSGDDGFARGTDLPDTIEIEAGAMTVRVRTSPYALEIVGPGDRTLLATPETGAACPRVFGGANLSPMPFNPHAFQVGESTDGWFHAAELLAVEESGGDTLLTVRAVDDETGLREAILTVRLRVESGTHLVLTASTSLEGVTYQTGAYRLDPDEHFFGLGLQYDSIDSRGRLRNMFLGLGVDLTDQVQNHAPMPFYISSRGYGLFVEEKGRGYFDMGRGSRCAYGYKYRTADLTTHIFWGPDPLDVIEGYTAVTGRPPMIPDYLFGHLHWRNKNHHESEVYDDAEALRSHGIPTSSIMVDAPWATAYNTFEFAECPSGCLFEDAQALIDHVHDKGYAFYLWTSEFTNRVSPVEAPGMVEDNSAQFDFARDRGYLVPAAGVLYEYPWWHDNGAMVNFLDPEAYDWVEGLVRNVMEMGVQGFKMDGGEFVGADTLGLRPLEVFGLGGFATAETGPYNYKSAYHRMYWELAREYNGDLGIATVRTAVWGEQPRVSYFWPGDMEANWGFELGLPADIVAGITLGSAGFPYYGSNNGGFTDYREDDPLLMARWTELSAFRPIFEGPKNGTQRIWEAFPPRIETIYRDYAVLHTRLFPYMKAYALEATRTGHPIMRMLPLHYLDDPETYGRDFDYLLGEWLLVAPVYLPGEYTRDVYLPAGRWVRYWTNEVLEGPRRLLEDAPEAVIPVFVKAGAVIPMLDASVQTLWPTDDPTVVDHTDVDDRLWVDLYPYGDTSFTLTDGTALFLSEEDTGFALRVADAPVARTYSLRAVPATYGGGSPTSVRGPSGPLPRYAAYEAWDSAPRGWFHDGATGDLWIRDACPAGTFRVTE